MTGPSKPPPAIRRHRGKFQVRYYGPDHRQHARSFARLADAKRYLNNTKADVSRGDWLDPNKAKTTFAEIVEIWRPGLTLERSTLDQHERALRVHLLPRFGHRPVGSIAPADVKQFIADLTNAGLAPATVTKYVAIFSKILKEAVVNGYIRRNPCTDVKKPGEQPLGEVVFLTAAELNSFSEAMDPRFAPMILLAGYRGLRFGEVAGLKERRLNLLQGQIQIFEALKEVSGEQYFGLPKHKKQRVMALPPFLVARLRTHLDTYPPVNGLLFTNEDKSLIRRSNFERRHFAPAVRRAGLDERLTFHGLRHTACSILIAEGAQMVELATIMGWAPSTAVKMSMRYGHLFQARESHLTEAVQLVYERAVAATEGQATAPTFLSKDDRPDALPERPSR